MKKSLHVVLLMLSKNRVTNVTLDVTLYPELNIEERTIMIAIKNNNKITREELARLIDKNTRTVQRILNGLKLKKENIGITILF